MEASSASSYDLATGSASIHRSTVPLLKGQLLCVQRQFDDALVILSTIDESRLPSRQRLIIAVERARCLGKLQMFDRVDEFAREAAQATRSDLEDDDIAYVMARLNEVERDTGRTYIDDSSARAAQALERHQALQTSLGERLGLLESRLGPASAAPLGG
jgi:outer membrane PBP1 activator LpoA protein